MKHYFRPEFLNRLDEIIVFLTKDEVKQISSILLREVCCRLTEKGISLEVTARFNDRLVEEGYNQLRSASLRQRNYASFVRLPRRRNLSGRLKMERQ